MMFITLLCLKRYFSSIFQRFIDVIITEIEEMIFMSDYFFAWNLLLSKIFIYSFTPYKSIKNIYRCVHVYKINIVLPINKI